MLVNWSWERVSFDSVFKISLKVFWHCYHQNRKNTLLNHLYTVKFRFQVKNLWYFGLVEIRYDGQKRNVFGEWLFVMNVLGHWCIFGASIFRNQLIYQRMFIANQSSDCWLLLRSKRYLFSYLCLFICCFCCCFLLLCMIGIEITFD